MTVLLQISALFLLMTAGFALGKLKLVDSAAIKGMSNLIIKATLPALIVMSLQRPFTRDLFGAAMETLLVATLFYAAIIALSLIAAKFLGGTGGERAVFAFSLAFSNCGFIGFPVVTSILGEDALFLTAISNIPFNVLAFTAGILIMEAGAKFDTKRSLDGTDQGGVAALLRGIPYTHLLNANVLAAIIGFGLFLTSYTLPRFIAFPLEMLGGVTTPLAMIVTGAMLARTSLRLVAGNWRVYAVSVLRLAVWPLVTALALHACGITGELFYITVIIAGMPAASNTSLIAEVYGGNTDTASAAVCLTTLFSVLTIPAMAILLKG